MPAREIRVSLLQATDGFWRHDGLYRVRVSGYDELVVFSQTTQRFEQSLLKRRMQV